MVIIHSYRRLDAVVSVREDLFKKLRIKIMAKKKKKYKIGYLDGWVVRNIRINYILCRASSKATAYRICRLLNEEEG